MQRLVLFFKRLFQRVLRAEAPVEEVRLYSVRDYAELIGAPDPCVVYRRLQKAGISPVVTEKSKPRVYTKSDLAKAMAGYRTYGKRKTAEGQNEAVL